MLAMDNLVKDRLLTLPNQADKVCQEQMLKLIYDKEPLLKGKAQYC